MNKYVHRNKTRHLFFSAVFVKEILHIFMVQYIHLIFISFLHLQGLFRILLPCSFNDRLDNHFALLPVMSVLRARFFLHLLSTEIANVILQQGVLTAASESTGTSGRPGSVNLY